MGAGIYGSSHGYVIPGGSDQNQHGEQPPAAGNTEKKDGKEKEVEKETRFKF